MSWSDIGAIIFCAWLIGLLTGIYNRVKAMHFMMLKRFNRDFGLDD